MPCSGQLPFLGLSKLTSPPREIRALEARDFLFRQGDEAHHVFVVEQGRIALTRFLRNGRSVVMHSAQAGESVAEAALFSRIYHCHAIADMESQVRVYEKKHLLDALSRNPVLSLEYMACLARHVQKLRSHLELRNIQSAGERILQFLLLEANPDSLEVVVETTLKDVAATLGLAHETFYRELANLENAQVIARHGKIIKILQTARI